MQCTIPYVPLKVVFLLHFVLVMWASLTYGLGGMFYATNFAVLFMGFWTVGTQSATAAEVVCEIIFIYLFTFFSFFFFFLFFLFLFLLFLFLFLCLFPF